MSAMEDRSTDEEALVSEMDSAHAGLCRAQLRVFSVIARVDRSELWRDWGAHDMAHWLSMRYGMSWWHAQRWISTAHALEELPVLAGAWSRGELGLDKVIELARFVTPETEHEVVAWAREASRTAVRRRADAETRRLEEVRAVEESRRVHWWYHDEGRRSAWRPTSPRPTVRWWRGPSTGSPRKSRSCPGRRGSSASRPAGPTRWS
jgi:hypothetical protein